MALFAVIENSQNIRVPGKADTFLGNFEDLQVSSMASTVNGKTLRAEEK
jgi:hypothetical protein